MQTLTRKEADELMNYAIHYAGNFRGLTAVLLAIILKRLTSIIV